MSVNGHFQHLMGGEDRKCKSARRRVQEEKEEQGEERKTSPCNLLPQHSFSDVVWHLVHKANQIHTLPSYIFGKGWVVVVVGVWWRNGVWGFGVGVKKGKSKSFVFTHTESLPETLDHISDSLLSSLLTQSHVKDWWGRWWTKINQSCSHSHRQAAKEAGEQTGRPYSVSKTRPRFSLAKSRLFWNREGLARSEAACCPLLSILWLH